MSTIKSFITLAFRSLDSWFKSLGAVLETPHIMSFASRVTWKMEKVTCVGLPRNCEWVSLEAGVGAFSLACILYKEGLLSREKGFTRALSSLGSRLSFSTVSTFSLSNKGQKIVVMWALGKWKLVMCNATSMNSKVMGEKLLDHLGNRYEG